MIKVVDRSPLIYARVLARAVISWSHTSSALSD